MEHYDVVVVGAGPAGSITAKTCAKAGLKTLMIEKRQEIGTPVRCAEGVGKDDLKRHIQPDSRWIAAEVIGSKIFSPDGTEITMSEAEIGGKAGYTLERKVFDRALAQEAAEAGADIMVKTSALGLFRVGDENNPIINGLRVKHLGKIIDFKADIVIGADGVESKVGRWGGIDTSLKPNDIDTCAQFLVSNIDAGEYSKFFLGKTYSPGGYVWIFPKGKHTANVGLGVLGSKCGDGARPITLLQEFMKKHLPQGKVIEMVVGGVPLSGQIDKTVVNGLMLVGDAARQSDPLTGGGIINAMDAGKIAGEVCIEAENLGDFTTRTLGEYEYRWRATIGHEINKSLKVKNLLVKLSDDDINTLAHSLVGMNTATMSLPKMVATLFMKNPKLLWELRSLVG